jgi:hypothetical protein
VYEEATYWSPSDFPNNGSVVTTVGDLGRWTTALGTGALLSKASFDVQTGDQNVGLGPLTADRYYGMGVVYANGWIFTNPQFDGSTVVLGYLPAKKATVAVASTFAPKSDITVSYGAAVFNRIAEILSPENAPNITVCPRGCCPTVTADELVAVAAQPRWCGARQIARSSARSASQRAV